MKKKILIFTDSRGQHKPAGSSHDVFAERLAKDDRFDVEMYMCPMKWTTTLDFLERFSLEDLESYDHVILYTGIVDWSPRSVNSARRDLYNNCEVCNEKNFQLNTNDYYKKIVNNKKDIFDQIFGNEKIEAYLNTPFEQQYEGEKTINMYGLDMARQKLIHRLKKIKNLIFINSNRFVKGWEGDFKRGRPSNINITHKYSELFRNELGSEKVIDLLQWNESEVMKYTCDNLHLTKAGSDFIYSEILNKINISQRNQYDSILIIGNGPSTKKLAEYGFENLPKNLHTFGMGAAYRYFNKIDWWPTYYAWCDKKVVHSHQKAFVKLIDDENISTKKFYFSLPISKNKRFEEVPHSSTGDFCFRKAKELGYKNIFIIGVEGDYIEELDISQPMSEKEYYSWGYDKLFHHFESLTSSKEESFRIYRDSLRVIKRTPNVNDNYFFDDYQRKGDVFSKPRSYTHRNAWKKSSSKLKDQNCNVYNISEQSILSDFPRIAFDEFLSSNSMKAKDSAFSPNGRPIRIPTPITIKQREKTLEMVGLGNTDFLASLIIGVKFQENDEARKRNLRFLLEWIDRYYGNLFDVLIVEQGASPKGIDFLGEVKSYVRYEYIYNPGPFNRGWGYNTAVRHFTKSKVLAMLDTDVLLNSNFLQEIINCHLHYTAISPYTNVYFTNESEAKHILETGSFESLKREGGVQKPTTICGGIVIIRRNTYQQLAGFEQYVEYGGEDRSLDVTLLNHCSPSEIRIAPYTYVHIHHPVGQEVRHNWKELFNHLDENYGCRVDPKIKPHEDIHKNCSHVSPAKTLKLMLQRADDFGDINLYRRGGGLKINGQRIDRNISMKLESTIYPPEFQGLEDYAEREVYQNTPDPDTEELSSFYNQYKGRRCFIIGNGPSLNKHDLSLLKDEYSFGVNSFYYKTRETGFRPFFYVVEDSSVMKENVEEIRAYNAPFKFFPSIYKSLHPKTPNTFFFHMNRGFYEKSSPNYCVPRFSTDASKVLYCGQSVTYINLQLAFFMGFTEVYLIGMDFDYVIPKEHKRKGDLITSTTDDPNHFHKDYFGKGKTWKDPKIDRVAINYKQAKLAYEAVGRKIFNATIGGKLEIFERVNYNSLFADKDTRSNNSVIKNDISLTSCSELLSSENRKKMYAAYSNANDKVSVTEANHLYSKGDFAHALGIYFSLREKRGLKMDHENVLRAANKLGIEIK